MNKNKEKTISSLIKEIIQISNFRNNPKQVMDDIIQLTFNITFSKLFQYATNPSIEYGVDEALIVELTDYKKNPEAWKLLIEASDIFILMHKNNEPFTDNLGDLYDTYLGKVLGQFLTPKKVAMGLSQFIGFGDQPLTEKTLISDICCGAGSLILAGLKGLYKQQGKESLKHIEIVCMDLDPKMVQLCAIQIVLPCIFHDINIHSLHMHWGNSITEYDPNSGKSTLAIVWKQEPDFFKLCNEFMGLLNQAETEMEKSYA